MKNTLFILLLLMSITSFAQNKKSSLRDGNELYADSSFNEAEMQYRKSLEKDQDYFNASFNLADAVYKQERYEESSALFDALKDDAPTKADLAKVYHNLGNSLVKEQKLAEAIDAYKSALRINPNDKDTRHNLALSQQQKQQQEQEQENKEEEEEDKENKDEQKENKEGGNKEEEKDNKEQEKNQENKEKQEDKPEKKKEEMSKETAEKMLEAIQQQEKNLQEELQKKKVKGKRVKVLKDW
ncbi:MAG: tetratricopeptide repeat protein [Flavobacteriales bacterium]|nr:tetratricopeptide repeat protein [Flavobacteriales bacterium]